MLDWLTKPQRRSTHLARARNGIGYLIVALLLILLIAQPGCLFRRKKGQEMKYPAAPLRLVLLPMNVPDDNPDLRWVALAVPVMAAGIVENAQDLDAVPLWEGLPVAIEALGASRNLTPEIAAYVASRLSARWCTQGEIAPSEKGSETSMLLDFIPSKATVVPFRYQDRTSLTGLNGHLHEAFEQFLRYLVARPLPKGSRGDAGVDRLREIAEALDREYGWFVTADPGKSDQLVSSLARSDNRLARLLFNPTLYPSLGGRTTAEAPEARPAAPARSESTPAEVRAPVTAGTPAPAAAAAPVQQVPAAEADRRSVAPPPEPEITLPPPRAFQQKVEPAAQRGAGPPEATKEERPAVSESRSPPQAMSLRPSTPSSKYMIQVYASMKKEEAEAVFQRLQGAGLTVVMETADLEDKGTWYRVRVVGYDSRKQTERAAEKLVADGLIKEYWILRP